MWMRRLSAAVALLATAGYGACFVRSTTAKSLDQSKSVSTSASRTATANEQTLAHDIVVLYDSVLLMNEQEGINMMDGTWANDASATLKLMATAQDNSAAGLKKITFGNAREESARKDLIHCQSRLSKDFSDMADACHQATTNKGWDNQSTALATKAFNDSKALPTDGSIAKLIKDPAFQAYLPQMFLEANGLIPDVNGFKLGVRYLVLDPLKLVYVQGGSLASTLGLQSLDLVIDVNGKQPKDMDDFKATLKKAAGQTITIHIKRMGITDMSYQATVPPNLKP